MSERFFYEYWEESGESGYAIFKRSSKDCSRAVAQTFTKDYALVITEALNHMFDHVMEAKAKGTLRDIVMRRIASQ
jgi:hypothetical protein